MRAKRSSVRKRATTRSARRCGRRARGWSRHGRARRRLRGCTRVRPPGDGVHHTPSLERPSMPVTYECPRPAVTVDTVVFGVDDEGLKVLLIQRDVEPHAGWWALPGGFVHEHEELDAAAMRALSSKTRL